MEFGHRHVGKSGLHEHMILRLFPFICQETHYCLTTTLWRGMAYRVYSEEAGLPCVVRVERCVEIPEKQSECGAVHSVVREK